MVFAPLAGGDKSDGFKWSLFGENESHVLHGPKAGRSVAFVFILSTLDDLLTHAKRGMLRRAYHRVADALTLKDHALGASVAEPLAGGGAVDDFQVGAHASISSSGPTKP